MKNELIMSVLTKHIKQLPFYVEYAAYNWIQAPIMRKEGFFCYTLLQCVSGKGLVVHNDDNIIVSEGDILIYSPHTPQYFHNVDDEKIDFTFGESQENKYIERLEQTPKRKPWIVNFIDFSAKCMPFKVEMGFNYIINFNQTEGTKMFKEITSLLTTGAISDHIKASSILYKFLNDIYVYKEKFDDNSELVTENLDQVIAYMKENLDKDISLEELSDLINVSSSYLCRIFKSKYKISPIKYLIELRINKAKEILKFNSGIKVYELAKLCGYDDPIYFGNQFKKHTGMTPGMFKNFRP